jgi:hypothetical protein
MLYVEADEIVPNLWQGSWPLPGGYVRASGFTMLILCAVEHQEPATLWPGVEVVYAPNFDDGLDEHKLNPERLHVALKAARRAAEAIQGGGKVLSTCAAGMNRSGLVTGITLHMMFGWEGDACVDHVRRKRKPWRGHRPLTNDDFTTALRRLARRPEAVPAGWSQTSSGIIVPV